MGPADALEDNYNQLRGSQLRGLSEKFRQKAPVFRSYGGRLDVGTPLMSQKRIRIWSSYPKGKCKAKRELLSSSMQLKHLLLLHSFLKSPAQTLEESEAAE